MKALLLTILLGFACLTVFSQAIISGKVTGKDGSLPGVSVYIEGTYDGTSTDDNGEFSFKTSKSGKALLKVESIGFEPYSKELELGKNPVKVEIALEEKFTKLEDRKSVV